MDLCVVYEVPNATAWELQFQEDNQRPCFTGYARSHALTRRSNNICVWPGVTLGCWRETRSWVGVHAAGHSAIAQMVYVVAGFPAVDKIGAEHLTGLPTGVRGVPGVRNVRLLSELQDPLASCVAVGYVVSTCVMKAGSQFPNNLLLTMSVPHNLYKVSLLPVRVKHTNHSQCRSTNQDTPEPL